MKVKRIIPLFLCLVLLLSVVPLCYAGSGVFSALTQALRGDTKAQLLSASSQWGMGSGWKDCPTASDIVFENTTDTAGANINRTLLDGA